MIIYDGRPDERTLPENEIGGFPIQANNAYHSYAKGGYDVYMYPYTNISEFAKIWNSIRGPYAYLLLFCHGAPGSIDCNGEFISDNPPEYSESQNAKGYHYSDILTNKIQITRWTELYSCHGGTDGNHGMSAARWISCMTNNSDVLAMRNASVGYNDLGKPTKVIGKKTLRNIFNFIFDSGWEFQRY